MHTRPSSSILLYAAGLCAVVVSSGPSRATSNQYVESFATTTYKDAVNTTAFWDIGTGELKLLPFVPSLVGTYDTPGSALGVAVAGDLAFVADAASGLRIISIANPASPSLVGFYNTPGFAFGVAVDGDLAFIADVASGLRIISIANPASPSPVGFYDTPGNAFGVAVAGDLAFVADDASGLRIINIMNPASPTLVGFYDTPGNAFGVAVDGDLAFVADRTSGLRIIDITNPASPSLAGFYDTPGDAQGVAVAGDLAFVCDGDAGFQIINIINPASPSLVATFNTTGFARGVEVAGDLAFVADDASGLQIIDITVPASPTLANTFDTSGAASHVVVDGDLAFVGDAFAGFQIVNITTQAMPRNIGIYNTPSFALDVAIAGDLAFVADDASGLRILDITNPASPTLVGFYNTPGFANGVAVAGDLAFVADLGEGLQVINITNPASPTLTGTYNTPGLARDVAVAGDLAFLADHDAGLQIINIANPASPTLTGTYNTPGWALEVAVAGDLAFVTDYDGGLQIINIANPASPTLTGTYHTQGTANGLAVVGDLAYVTNGASELRILNIVNPASPTLVGTCDVFFSVRDVAVAGDLAFVADYERGLQIVNVANPATPTFIETLYAFCTLGVVVEGDLVFMAGEASGLYVMEVFNHSYHTRGNIGQSLQLDSADEMILRARLLGAKTAGVSLALSADAGTNWQVFSNNAWTKMNFPGSDLLWRSTHTLTTPGLNPTVSDLQIDWRFDVATIAGVLDIPGDQGGWVRLQMLRSGLDFVDELTLPISHYGVWRRSDGAVLATALTSASRADEIESSVADAYGALPIVGYDDRVFIQSAHDPMGDTFPPGTWELVQTIPALQQDTYLAAIPTEADSTVNGMHHTVLVVTAHTTTPSIWYASPPDSGYSVDNSAPAVPTNFAIAYNTGSGNTLAWDPSPDDDFQIFRVYRSTDPNFTPSPATLVHATTSTGWVDPEYDGGGIHYAITALDYAGNESDPATASLVTSIEGPRVPEYAALYQNHPNPFNPVTVIRYDVPRGGGDVHLSVYDVSGRLVRELVSWRESPGEKTVRWDGRADAGVAVSTGVYFYRITIGKFTATRKMVLLK